MMKKNKNNEANAMPESLTELKPIVDEFVKKMEALENEEESIRESKKDLVEEYADKLDVKTLNLALKMMKLKNKVEHKHYFDMFVEVLSKD